MIDLTRRKRKKISISEINFNSTIKRSLESLSSLDSAYRLTVNKELDESYPFYSDQEQIDILFNNIISNAIKHQHSYEMNPKLEIHVTVESGKSVILFKDNGIGIPSDELRIIFDMFYRGKKVKSEGSGLGLYVVKEVIKKLKGKIYVDSELGEGSQFVIELPNKIDPDLLRKLEKLKRNAD